MHIGFPTISSFQPHSVYLPRSISTNPSVSLSVDPSCLSYATVNATRPCIPPSTVQQGNPKMNLDAPSSHTDHLRYKFSHLRSSREKGNLICYRCGNSGHLANSCRNSLICFACGRLWHIFRNYRSVTMAHQFLANHLL
jgi:Zinc knuckle